MERDHRTIEQQVAERFAEWKRANSLERRPLTDERRALFEQDLQTGILRATLAEDGSVHFETAYASVRGGGGVKLQDYILQLI